MSFYVEAVIPLVGEDQAPLARADVELVAEVLMDALADQPGDLDVAADLARSELTICGFFEGTTARDAIDRADDLIRLLAKGLDAQLVPLPEPSALNARPSELLPA